MDGREPDQIELNSEAYEDFRESLERDHPGEYALMHDGRVVDTFGRIENAYRVGREEFGDGRFFIREVGAPPVDLGIHSARVVQTVVTGRGTGGSFAWTPGGSTSFPS